ncbi:MAG: TFIIB-type zinc ribbon-containing protein [Planctomycetota bacterium]|jgi:hypothetical protein
MPLPRFSRHPLCPECKYDVVATIDAGSNVCPECGCIFEPHELLYEVRPGDWTLWRGTRKALGALALRGLICLLFWTGLIIGLTLIVEQMTLLPRATRWGLELVSGLTIIGTGATIGWFMASGMNDRAGFTGWSLTLLVVLAAWIVIFVAVTAVELLGLVSLYSGSMLMLITGIGSGGWIIKILILDEM